MTESEFPKWLINIRDENDVIVYILNNFNTRDLDECLEARSLYQRYLAIQQKLKLNRKEYPIDYEELSWTGEDSVFRKDRLRAVRSEDCELCNNRVGPILQIHHVRPRSFGGDERDTNLILLCPTCHSFVHYAVDNRDQIENILNGWQMRDRYFKHLVVQGSLETYVVQVSKTEQQVPLHI